MCVALALSGCDPNGQLGDPCLGTGTLPEESMEAFAAKCAEATQIEVRGFNCDDGTIIPTTNLTPGACPNQDCDAPNVLNGECDECSRFQVLAKTEEAIAVGLCRKKGLDEGEGYRDVAVIQYNRFTGATCFYQALGPSLPAEVTAPSQGIGPGTFPWFTPSQTAGEKCVMCHDNGPFVRSPYLAQLRDVGPNPDNGVHRPRSRHLHGPCRPELGKQV